MVDKQLLDEKKAQLESKLDYTVQELSDFLGIPRVTVQSWVNRGLFPNAHKRGNVWIIPTTDIMTFQPSRAGRKPPLLDSNGYPPILLYIDQPHGYNTERNHAVFEDVEKAKNNEIAIPELIGKWGVNRARLYRIHRDEKRRLEREQQE